MVRAVCAHTWMYTWDHSGRGVLTSWSCLQASSGSQQGSQALSRHPRKPPFAKTPAPQADRTHVSRRGRSPSLRPGGCRVLAGEETVTCCDCDARRCPLSGVVRSDFSRTSPRGCWERPFQVGAVTPACQGPRWQRPESLWGPRGARRG